MATDDELKLAMKAFRRKLRHLIAEDESGGGGRYGFGGTYCRVETDGSRFAATCRLGGQMRIATLAHVNDDVVLHEALQSVATGVNPNLASKRSGGGISAEYAMVCTGTTPAKVPLPTSCAEAAPALDSNRLTIAASRVTRRPLIANPPFKRDSDHNFQTAPEDF